MELHSESEYFKTLIDLIDENKILLHTNLKRKITFCTDKGMVRSDMSKSALIFFHCKSTHNKIHCQKFSC
jgi:hypothetical protein